MEKLVWEPLPNVDVHCFGCGAKNNFGLKMRFEASEHQLRSKVIVPPHMRGWNNIVHGGILSTICDEIMSWAAIFLTQKFILTKQLTVSFLKPVVIETELIAKAEIKNITGERHAILSGEIFDNQGERVTSSQGEFILFTEDQFQPLNIVPDEFIDLVVQKLFQFNG